MAPVITSLGEPALTSNPLKNAYMGELHLHTAYSLDAYIFGTTLNDPFAAFRYAQGEEVEMPGGVNPFKHGIIGSTDNHNGTPGDTEEDRFMGHYANNDADPKVRLGLKANPTAEAMSLTGDDDPTRLYNPGGLAGVWAENNTREAIWDALHRKETFGTSGTRTKIRLMGGFGLPADLHTQSDWVKIGYEKGVPQGGNLSKASAGSAPTFVLRAQTDLNSAPLARLQIVKGWTEGDELRESTYDVACSDGPVPDPATHRCPDNGASVNLEDCSTRRRSY